jgi:uncharacterized protein (UPF0332 family)
MAEPATYDREAIAKQYWFKAQESILAAKGCLKNQHYRAACNRAWYAVMQAITAAAYLVLDDQPTHNDTWRHSQQQGLFRRICKKLGHYNGNRKLIRSVPALLNARQIADYSWKDCIIGEDAANEVVRTASRIIERLENMISM